MPGHHAACEATLQTSDKRAGVREITYHELRHTFGTRVAAAGVPLRTLQYWMGHADSKTTQIYAHYQPAENEAKIVDRAFAPAICDRSERSSLTHLTSPESPESDDIEGRHRP